MTQKGFTLIELLVVIAIIGILSGVVLTSLNQARGKASDAAVKANLANIRAQAELYYDTNNDYGLADTCAEGMFSSDSTIASQVTAAEQQGGGAASCTAVQDPDAWAVSVPLKTTPTIFWCVDSTGKAATSSAAATGGACS